MHRPKFRNDYRAQRRTDVGSSGIRIWLVYPIFALTFFLLLVAALYYWLRQGEDSIDRDTAGGNQSESDVLAG
jgi:uncharacterized membrane protein